MCKLFLSYLAREVDFSLYYLSIPLFQIRKGVGGGVLHSLTYSDLADQSHFKPSVPFTLVGQYSVGPFYFWKVHLLMTVKSIVSTLYYQSLKQRYFSKFNFSMLHYQSHPRLNKGISLSLIIT